MLQEKNMKNRKVLVIFAHTYFEKSRLNKKLLEAISGLENITIHNLTSTYPDYKINIAKEQQLLLEHDHIVLQFPFFWYSCPAIMKLWLDEVLTFGFAYGEGGDKLHGKTLRVAITTGGNKQAYSPEGYNRFHLIDLLSPFDQTAHLCGINWCKPFLIQGSRVISDHDLDQRCEAYKQLLLDLASS